MVDFHQGQFHTPVHHKLSSDKVVKQFCCIFKETLLLKVWF